MEQEFIEHIKDQLGDFELNYREGAWEEFRDKKGRRKFFLRRKVQLAAAALLFLSLFIPGQFTRLHKGKAGKELPVTVSSLLRDKNLKPTTPAFTSIIFKPGRANRSTRMNRSTAAPDRFTGIDPVAGRLSDLDNAAALGTSENRAALQPRIPSKKTGTKKLSFEEMLALESTQRQQPSLKAPAGNKWGFAVSFGQALDTRSKADLSFGAHISYALNSRLSLTSALLFDQLGAAKKYPLPEISARTGRYQSGSQAALTGVEVPLELHIKTGRQTYASIGISAYAIVSQHQTLDFGEQKTVVTNYVDGTGTMRTETITTKELSTEAVSEKELQHNKMAGFYNFSLGYQQKVFTRNVIALEPYVKIPVAGYSEQRLNLLQGGVRLKFGF